MAILPDLDLAESVGVGESLGNDQVVPLAEAFLIADSQVVNPTVIIAETLGLLEAMTTDEIADILVSLNLRETLPFKANAVISELQLFDSIALTVFSFGELTVTDRPLGFDKFTELVPGERDYQEALLKFAFRLKDQLSGDKIGLGKTVLNVDVPDILDSDQTAIPMGGTTINFNRTFNVIPTMSVSIQSGSSARRAEISSVTTTSFFAETFSTGASVAGVIDWAAKGF